MTGVAHIVSKAETPDRTERTGLAGLDDEVVRFCSDLIRFDTTVGQAPERPAAEYIAALLAEVGVDSRIIEAEPGRANLIARIEGADSSLPPLLVHGHLDTVPADRSEWSVDPLSGEIRDGSIWGRGAVDMQNMNAMVVSGVRALLSAGRRPRRDLVLAFVADEEAGGELGAAHLVRTHPELFADCTVAIGEVGGFSVPAGDRNMYLLETSHKSAITLRLSAHGSNGHGSMLHESNALVTLTEALGRLARHTFPHRLTATTRRFLQDVEDIFGASIDLAHPDDLRSLLGTAVRAAWPSLHHTATPTVIRAGLAGNVVSGHAEADVDCRTVPGLEAEFRAEVEQLLGGAVDYEFIDRGQGGEAEMGGRAVAAMTDAIRTYDPDAHVVPMCMPTATDARHFRRLGIECYGFVPMRLPAGFDFLGRFHGIDEHVPVSALQFGARTLTHFLSTY